MAPRLALLALLWWVITNGDPASWAWGLPAILLAAVLVPPYHWHLRPLALLWFVPQTLWLALSGGVKVAWLACQPRLSLNTQVIHFRWQHLSDGPGRMFMASLINLIPGTLTLEIGAEHLQVHVLHLRPDTLDALHRLERRIARLYGETINE